MDTSRISRGQMIVAAGGIGLIVSLFITWAAGVSAFKGFSAMDIIMLIVGIAALAYALAPAAGFETRLPPRSGLVVAVLALAVFGWAFGFELEVSGDFGVWLAVLSSLAIAYGVHEGMGAARPAVGSVRRPADPAPAPAAGTPPVPPPGL